MVRAAVVTDASRRGAGTNVTLSAAAGEVPRGGRPWWPPVAATAATVLVFVLAASLSAFVLHRSVADDVTWELAWLSYVAVGTFVAQRRPQLPVGWVLLVIGALVQVAAVADKLAAWAGPMARPASRGRSPWSAAWSSSRSTR
jgi:hypothetical protein